MSDTGSARTGVPFLSFSNSPSELTAGQFLQTAVGEEEEEEEEEKIK